METNRAKIIQLLYTGEPVNVELALQLAKVEGIALTKEFEVIRYFFINGSRGAVRQANLEETISIEEMIKEIRSYRYLSFNAAFKEIHHHALNFLEQLSEIYFYHTTFKAIPSVLYNIKSICKLIVLDGDLQKLDSKIIQLTNLRLLRLTNNQLEAIPDNIGTVTSLQELYLNNNNLKHIPASIGQLQNLKTLYLGGNQLVTLPEELKLLKNLTKFSVYANPLDYNKIPRSLLEGDSIVASQLRRIFCIT